MNPGPRTVVTTIPGTESRLTVRRDGGGRLLHLSAGGRVYVEADGDERVLDGGFVRLAEIQVGRALVRRVHAGERVWTERYEWDAALRPTLVDGVTVQRDREGRITACQGADGTWRYAYRNGCLAVIEGPDVRRQIEHCGNRPVILREAGVQCHLHYDGLGRRSDAPCRPRSWACDEAARLWVVRDPIGEIRHTFLWDGFNCIGRIDGPPGAPLAAAFSLDLTGTPVRVVTADDVLVLPRDAFGESLLEMPGVPGLFGGAAASGHFFYRGRSLDPRIGAFDAPDPWDGSAEDPRRRSGYRGTLPVEIEPRRAYVVCRNDPIGRADPTGEMSAGVGATLLTLSTLTWSSQHNLSSLLVLDFPLNFFLALTTFEGDKIKRWFDKEGMASPYTGAWGFRFDPVGLERWNINVGRPWTYQHVVWSRAENFDDLARARAFVPGAAFEPTLYGTVLRVSVPRQDDDHPATSFVLRGSGFRPALPHPTGPQIPALAPPWTRSGGPARRVLPGADSPWFPEGGLHFAPQVELHAPREATVTELGASSAVGRGTFELRKVLSVPERPLAVAASDDVLLSTKARAMEILTVRSTFETGSETRVRFEANPTLAATDELRLRTLSRGGATNAAGVFVPHPVEALSAGHAGGRLDATSVAGPAMAANEVLRIEQGGVVVGTAMVDALDARLTVDVALDAARGPSPHSVFELREQAVADRDTELAGARDMDFQAGQAPAVGAVIAVKGGGTTTLRLVTEAPSADRRVVDRALPAPITTAAVGTVKWRPTERARPQALGVWDKTAGTTDLTYRPDVTGTVIASGHVVIRDGDGDAIMVRDVTAIGFDELVVSADPLPGAVVNPYDVTRYALGGVNVADCTQRDVHALALTAAPNATIAATPRPALQLLQLSAAPPLSATGTPLLSGLAMPAAPATAVTLSLPGDALKLVNGTLADTFGPTPGQAVVLRSTAAGIGPEVAIVRRLRLTVTFDRELDLGAAPWSIVPLDLGGFFYLGQVEGPDKVVLSPQAYRLTAAQLPNVGAGPVAVQMPRITVGEPVHAVWNGGADEDLFRVKSVDGTTLTLEGGNIAALVAAAPGDLALARLVPVAAGTGRAQAGIRGSLMSVPPANTQARFDVWSPSGLSAATLWAASDGSKTLPARIGSRDALEVEFEALPAGFAGAAGVEVIAPEIRTGPGTHVAYASEYDIEADDLIFPDDPIAVGPELVLAVPHVAAPSAASADGRLSPGTVMIPDDDTESWHLDNRQALVTHELRHTQQSSWMGPVLLGLNPIFLLDAIAHIAGSDLEDPEYSSYVEARIVTIDGLRFLEIPDRQGLDFEADRAVEISQSGQVVATSLGAESEGRFRLLGADMLAEGTVFLRLPKSGLGTVLATIYDIGSILTLGGVMTNVMSFVLGFLPTVIGGFVNLAKSRSFFDPFDIDFLPARVPDPNRPSSIEPLANAEGETISLDRNEKVRVRAGDRSLDTDVTAIRNGTVELAQAPPTAGDDRHLEIAGIGDTDPLGQYNSFLSRIGHMQWLRWVYDPWGQLHFRATPEPDSAVDWVLRVARWGFSSTSWSFLPPGMFVWDNALPQSRLDVMGQSEGYLSKMEQDASEVSGELYTPMSRLHGTLDVVGDIARFRYFKFPFESPNPDQQTAVPLGRQDAPGVNVDPHLWVMPSFAATAAGTTEPNGTNEAHQVSANQIPDSLYAKDLANPDQVGASGPNRFQPTDRGHLPMAAHLQRTIGSYVAFSRPPDPAGRQNLITVDQVNFAFQAGRAQEQGIQTISFARTVKDVTVRIAGREVANDATLRLVLCQRAPITVEPDGDRRYDLMLRRPSEGPIVRRGGDLVLQVQTATGTEPAEIARVHGSNPFSIPDDEAPPWPQFLYDEAVAIPVRGFAVEVVDTVGIHESLTPDPGNPPLPPIKARARPGEEAFLLVPAWINSVRPALAVAYPSVAAMPPNSTDPNPAVRPETPVPEALHAALGDGGILRLTFAPDDPPEEEAELTWTIQVRARQPRIGGGTEDISANLTARIIYEPHFRLELPAPPTDTVARGGSITLRLSGGVQAGAVVVTPSLGMTATVQAGGSEVRIDVDAAADPTARQVVVEDAANADRRARRTLLVT